MPMCDGKKRYPSRLVALLNGVRYLGREQNAPEALRPYECPLCGGWHLTKQVNDEQDLVLRKCNDAEPKTDLVG